MLDTLEEVVALSIEALVHMPVSTLIFLRSRYYGNCWNNISKNAYLQSCRL